MTPPSPGDEDDDGSGEGGGTTSSESGGGGKGKDAVGGTTVVPGDVANGAGAKKADSKDGKGETKKTGDSTPTPSEGSGAGGDEDAAKPEGQDDGKPQKEQQPTNGEKKEPQDGRGETRAPDKPPPPPPPKPGIDDPKGTGGTHRPTFGGKERPPQPPPEYVWPPYGPPPPPGDGKTEDTDGKETKDEKPTEVPPTGGNTGVTKDDAKKQYAEVEDPCKKELWLGFFFEGARPRGAPKFTGTTIQVLKSKYKSQAKGRGANADTFYGDFEASTSPVVSQKDTDEFKDVYRNAMTWFCNKVCAYLAGGCDKAKIKIDIFGWSRGAIMGTYIAGTLNSGGCKCGGKGVHGFPVRFIGLIDPVDTALRIDAEMMRMQGDTKADIPGDVDNSDSRDYSLPASVENFFVAYMFQRTAIGWAAFRADFVFPGMGANTKNLSTKKKYKANHESAGWAGSDDGAGKELGESFGGLVK